jgi:hypothetical protein
MIHPHSALKYINDTIGYGVFATADLPEGTITYVKDSLEICISPTDYLMHSAEMQSVIDKYSYKDEHGCRIVSWDFAKYVNHCCNFNTISTGYGFEIAIRDIQAGEQITDEYSIFNLEAPMKVDCGDPTCRRVVHPDDFERYYPEWDRRIRLSLKKLFEVEQPLINFLDPETRTALDNFYADTTSYQSVYALKMKPNNA